MLHTHTLHNLSLIFTHWHLIEITGKIYIWWQISAPSCEWQLLCLNDQTEWYLAYVDLSTVQVQVLKCVLTWAGTDCCVMWKEQQSLEVGQCLGAIKCSKYHYVVVGDWSNQKGNELISFLCFRRGSIRFYCMIYCKYWTAVTPVRVSFLFPSPNTNATLNVCQTGHNNTL